MKPIPEQRRSAFKVGPNKVDQLKIKQLAADGVEPEEISLKLKIQLESVKSWIPKKKVIRKKEA